MVDPLAEAIAAFPNGTIAYADKTDKTAETWGTPDETLLNRSRAGPPDLPTDLLCPAWMDWLADAADAKGAPVDYIAGALIAIAGSLIGNARWSQPWPDWSEPPVIWVALVGEPSSGKTPAILAVKQPLRTLEREIAASDEKKVAAWRAEKAKAQQDGEAFDKPSPHVTRLEVSDGTIERLGEIARLQPRGVFYLADELASLLTNLGRYNGGDDSPFWLKAFGGEYHCVERKSYSLRIPHLSVGVLGGIQPSRLNSLLLSLCRVGFLARFLPLGPPRRRGAGRPTPQIRRQPCGRFGVCTSVTWAPRTANRARRLFRGRRRPGASWMTPGVGCGTKNNRQTVR